MKRPRINRDTRIPQYSVPVELRIKQAKAELYKGLSKAEAAWESIKTQVQLQRGGAAI